MDLVPLVNGAAGQIGAAGSLFDFDFTTWLVLGAAVLLFYWLFKEVGRRLTQSFTDAFINNWRLGLLGLTGVVLSVASGWTTWDGMRNFTKEPVLSLLITFGIQGVMLIVAWLIGESFATGMSHRPRRGFGENTHPGLRALQPVASSIAGILLFAALGILVYGLFVPDADPLVVSGANAWWAAWWDKLIIAVPVVLVLALLIVNAGSDVLEDYTQSLRIMVRSAVLWVMFLACMATSVFFSFDSLFSTIFPAEERARAAELRAQNQVAGVVNDIARLTASRRLSEQEALFTGEAWQRYEDNLDRLATLTGSAGQKLQAFFEARMRERQQEINRFQEDKSSAAAQQIALVQRKAQLNAQISRLTEQVTNLSPEVDRLKGLVFQKDREVIAKTAEAEAEAGGIGVTSKIGRGPKYREIAAELYRLKEEKENLELQLREYAKRLGDARKALTSSETELARIDGEIAKLKGRAATAEKMIEARAKNVDELPSFNATTGAQQLADAREKFRREPTADGLTRVHSVCTALAGALRDQADPETQRGAGSIDCDPGAASEAAQRVFALNIGVQKLRQNCVGGDKLPVGGGADALFAFARGCVQDAQLASQDTNNLRQLINSIELNRDDKAHRFVVTTNAFQDGNKLAYLALAIAIAIDTLVFMSGLFGANAVRSPLSDVPSYKGRSARQLEDVVENALLPDKFENAMHALEALQPVAPGTVPRAIGDGWTHESIVPDPEIDQKRQIIKVLNAGATIGAVRRDETYPARYLVRGELVEFLNQVAKNAFERDGQKVRLAELRKVVSVALQPYVSDHADVVLGHMNPISDMEGFSSEINMGEVPPEDTHIVRRALNGGATLGFVQRQVDKEGRDWFYIRNEFYRVLAALSADVPKTGMRLDYGRPQIAGPAAQHQVDGGTLQAEQTAGIASRQVASNRQIADAHSDAAAPADPHDGSADAATSSDTAGIDGGPIGDVHDATAANDSGDVRRDYLEQLIGALDIDPANWDQLTGALFGRAIAASEVFGELRGANLLLDRNIRQRDQHIQDRLAQAMLAAGSHPASGGDANWRRQMLESAREDIEQNWAVIMMLPGGPYEVLLQQMIEAYEQDDAEGRLDPAKQHLLRNIKAIRQALAANPRDSEAAWQQLGTDFEEIARAAAEERQIRRVV